MIITQFLFLRDAVEPKCPLYIQLQQISHPLESLMERETKFLKDIENLSSD